MVYPCEFCIKIIGLNELDFDEVITSILQRHVQDLPVDNIQSRLSSGGKYRSLTSTFTADSRAQLDNLYIELSGHKYVKWII